MNKQIIGTLLVSTLVSYAAVEADLTKGVDITGQTSVTAGLLNQLVDNGKIKAGKGIVIASTTVPDVNLNNRYTNFLWLDLNYSPPVLKIWITSGLGLNPNNTTNWASASATPGSITEAMIAAGAVTSSKIANGAVGNSQINTNSISNSQLQYNSVGRNQIQDGEVINAKLGAGSVTGDKIAAGVIINANLAYDSVSSNNIIANSINPSKIPDYSIPASKLVTGTLTFTNLGQINGTNIAGGTITGTNIAGGTVVSSNLAANCVNDTNIANGAVTPAKLSFSVISPVAHSVFIYEATGGNMTETNTIGADVINMGANLISIVYSNVLTITNYPVFIQEEDVTTGQYTNNTAIMAQRTLTNCAFYLNTTASRRYNVQIFGR